MNSTPDAAVLADAERLQEWLVGHEQRPYVDFEILTVTLSDQALEVDPMGNAQALVPLLERFAARHRYDVGPLNPETGTISLLRNTASRN